MRRVYYWIRDGVYKLFKIHIYIEPKPLLDKTDKYKWIDEKENYPYTGSVVVDFARDLDPWKMTWFV